MTGLFEYSGSLACNLLFEITGMITCYCLYSIWCQSKHKQTVRAQIRIMCLILNQSTSNSNGTVEFFNKFFIYNESTKNATLIITDFLVMIYKNEHPCTASLCRGWAMLENDFNLICRWHVILVTPCRLKVHMAALCINRLWFQFDFAPSLCR